MRWTQWPRWTSEGLLRTAKSCGPGTPTLVSSFAEVFREATVAKEPGHWLFDSHISELQCGAVFDTAKGFEAKPHDLWTGLSIVGGPSS